MPNPPFLEPGGQGPTDSEAAFDKTLTDSLLVNRARCVIDATMAAAFSETTSKNWLGRLGDSIKGILVGLLLFVIGGGLLWMNEKNSAQTIAGLKELFKVVIPIDAASVNPETDGLPVHLSGLADSNDVLTDGAFGVNAEAIKLIREVEMLQWQETKKTETKKKLGGGEETVTSYDYATTWASEPINSGQFHPNGRAEHQNPSMPFQRAVQQAKEVALGAYQLSPFLVEQMNSQVEFVLDEKARRKLPEAIRSEFIDEGPGYYRGDPKSPKVGDVKVRFFTVQPDIVSVIAQQSGNTFEKYRAKNGKAFGMLEMGDLDPEGMIQVAQSRNKFLTWILRIVGWLLMMIGLSAILRPLSVVADVVPMIGNLVGAGTGFIAALMATAFALIIISVSWILYRPMLSIPLAVLALILIVFAFMRMGRKKKAA